MKMCIIGWLIELIGTLLFVSFTYLHSFGVRFLHIVDCIIINVIIPFVYLMNDEETKGTITEEGWYHGMRNMLGIPVQPNSRD